METTKIVNDARLPKFINILLYLDSFAPKLSPVSKSSQPPWAPRSKPWTLKSSPWRPTSSPSRYWAQARQQTSGKVATAVLKSRTVLQAMVFFFFWKKSVFTLECVESETEVKAKSRNVTSAVNAKQEVEKVENECKQSWKWNFCCIF